MVDAGVAAAARVRSSIDRGSFLLFTVLPYPRGAKCFLRGLLAAALAQSFLGLSYAIEPDQPLSDLNHRAFTSSTGAPGDANAFGQTPDGYLWIGSSSGLFKFDGVKFSRYAVIGDDPRLDFDVSALLVTASGDIWVGSRFGGIYRLRAGRVTVYGTGAGVPAHTISDLAVDRDGVIWASTASGVFKFDGTRWSHVPVGVNSEAASESFQSVRVDGTGAVWVAGNNGVFCLPRGSHSFAPSRAIRPPGRVLLDGLGGVWCADQQGLLALNGDARRLDASGLNSGAKAARELTVLLIDREGAAWGVLGNAFVRIPSASRWLLASASSPRATLEALAAEQRLSGAIPRKVFEDREGDIWVGTNGGLDRFRSGKFRQDTLSGQSIPQAALAASQDGTLWIGTDAQGLIRQANIPIRTGVLDGDGVEFGVFSLYVDTAKTLWIGGRRELWKTSGPRYERVPLPFEGPRSVIQAITKDGAGALWVSVVGRGIFKLTDDQWTDVGVKAGLATALSLHTDELGRIWLGFPNNRLALFDHEKVKWLDKSSGVDVGNVLAMSSATENRMWIGGSSGVALYTGDRIVPLIARDGSQIEGASGIAQTSSGELWINGAHGVTRIAASEVRRFLSDTSVRVDTETFDAEDGVWGAGATLHPVPTAMAAPDGRLWFATMAGLFSIDPAHIARNPVLPTSLVTGVIAKGEDLFAAFSGAASEGNVRDRGRLHGDSSGAARANEVSISIAPTTTDLARRSKPQAGVLYKFKARPLQIRGHGRKRRRSVGHRVAACRHPHRTGTLANLVVRGHLLALNGPFDLGDIRDESKSDRWTGRSSFRGPGQGARANSARAS